MNGSHQVEGLEIQVVVIPLTWELAEEYQVRALVEKSGLVEVIEVVVMT